MQKSAGGSSSNSGGRRGGYELVVREEVDPKLEDDFFAIKGRAQSKCDGPIEIKYREVCRDKEKRRAKKGQVCERCRDVGSVL